MIVSSYVFISFVQCLCVIFNCIQTFYGPALEILNEIRHVALVSDMSFLFIFSNSYTLPPVQTFLFVLFFAIFSMCFGTVGWVPVTEAIKWV